MVTGDVVFGVMFVVLTVAVQKLTVGLSSKIEPAGPYTRAQNRRRLAVNEAMWSSKWSG